MNTMLGLPPPSTVGSLFSQPAPIMTCLELAHNDSFLGLHLFTSTGLEIFRLPKLYIRFKCESAPLRILGLVFGDHRSWAHLDPARSILRVGHP